MRHLCFLECFRRKQLIAKLISSHKAEKLSNHCRNKERSLSFASDKGSVSCEKPEATVALLLEQVSKYCNC